MSNPRSRLQLLIAAVVVLAALQPSGVRGADQISWKTRGPGGGGNFFPVGVSPDNPQIVLMGSDTGGIYRSANGGQTWQVRNDALIDPARYALYDFEAFKFTWDPAAHDTVYAGTLKSTNAGVNWHETVKPHIITWVNAIDPANHNIVYAAGYANVYRSDCAWDGTPSCPTEYSCSTLPDPGSQIRAVVLDPANSGHVIACADTGLYESTFAASVLTCNGPWQWTKITNVNLAHDECNDLVLDAASHTLFMTLATHFTTDCSGWRDVESWRGGIRKTTIPSTGTTWGSLTWSDLGGADDPSIMDTRNPGFETGSDPDHPIAASWIADSGTITRDCVSTGGVSHSGDCSMKMGMSGSGGSYFKSEPIPIQTGGLAYRISAWAKVSYPSTPGACSQTTSGCSVGTSFFGRIWWYKDAAGTDPLAFPGYATNNQSPALASSSPQFDPAANGGWRKVETLIASRTGAASIRIEFNNDGNCTGATWVDDVSLEPVHNLPKVGGSHPGYAFVNYDHFVIDPLDLNTIYVGTLGEGSHFLALADTEGVWKTTDGGTTWSLTTRGQYQDNVLDGYLTGPNCGDGICAGRGENCTTCPEDCTTQNPQIPALGCCGDNVCATGEHGDNTLHLYCFADCPVDPDPNRNVGGSEYFDAVNTPLSVWGLGIGSGSQGRNTLYFGSAQAYVTTNAGGKWTELSADPQSNAVPPLVTWKARGDTNAVITYSVVTDSRAPGRLYYGDTDNFLQISYDGGLTFAKEGAPDWGRLSDTSVNPPVPQPINGDSCTAILLDKDYPGHVGSPNRIYAGISTGDIGGGALRVGVAQGDFDPAAASKNPWTWKPLGDQRTFPQTGGVDLVRDDSGNFYAAVYGAGVYKLSSGATPSTPWTRACLSPTDCSNWLPAPPNGWETYRIARDVTSGRLYVSAGYPYATSLQPAADTGVWESANNGATWNKINDASIDQEAITALLPDGPNTLFVATTYSEEATTTDGGVYRGERGSNGTWTWTRALAQPKVTGIAISPADSSLLYAFSGQVCCYSGPDVPGQQAGIWKSTGGGKAGTWGSAPLSNNGLMDLIHARLSFSENDTHTLYASTAGAGLFEGTITCTDQVRDFECSTRLNPASPLILDGVVTSGSVNSLAAGSLDDTYQVFAESGNGSKKKLTLVWTFAGAQAGIGYNLRVEGFLNPTSNDSFAFSYATRASGTCTGHEPTWTNLSPPLTVATPDDQIQSYGLGALPAGTTVFCVRVQDSRTSGDSQADTLTLDRVYLLPT